MSNGRRVPPNGSPTPPRGPRPAGFYGRGTDYDQTPGGPRAGGRSPRAGRPGWPGRAARASSYSQQYYGPGEDQYGQAAPGSWSGRDYGQGPAAGWARQGQDQYGGAPGPNGHGQPRADQYGPQQPGQSTGRPGPGQPGQAASEPRQPRYGAEYPGAGPDPFRAAGYGPPGHPAARPGSRVPASTGRASTSRPSTSRASTSRPSTSRASTGRTRANTGSWQAAGPGGPAGPVQGQTWAGRPGQTPRTRGTPDPGRPHRDKAGRAVRDSPARASITPGRGRRPDQDSTVPTRAAPAPGRRPGRVRGRRGRPSPGSSVPGRRPGRRPGPSTGRTGLRARDSTLRTRVTPGPGRRPGQAAGADRGRRAWTWAARSGSAGSWRPSHGVVADGGADARGRTGRPGRGRSVPAFTPPARGGPPVSSRDGPGQARSSSARSSATPVRGRRGPARRRTGTELGGPRSAAIPGAAVPRAPVPRSGSARGRPLATRTTALPRAATVPACAPPARSTERAIRSSGNGTARCLIPRRAARE